MKRVFWIICFSILLTGCKFSRSVEKDLLSGMTSSGKDLACEEVYIELNEERTTRSKFIYGERFFVFFDNITGFTSEKGNVFPGMEISVTDIYGDTLLSAGDLYEGYTEGMNYSPLRLSADLMVADPIKSKDEYKLAIFIWDKKGTGTFRSELNFEVIQNDKIEARPKGVTYSEIYLFSQGYNKVITDNTINFEDNIFIIAEGLKGFNEENGKVFPGMQLTGTDSRGEIILSYDDLFADYTSSDIDASEFSTRVSANFRLTGMEFNNPLRCELKIWDKRSNASLTVTIDMTVK
ncbi:MAG: hypothetical protein V1903_10455 [Bacteroidota bacterium]